MSKVEHVLELGLSGLSCSQAMLAAYGPDHGLDRDLAVRLGAGLGGGLGLTGEVCGAVNAGCMLLGLILGSADETDKERRELVHEAVRLFLERFAERRGTVLCREIMAKEGIRVPEEWDKARETGLLPRLCPEVIRDAALTLEDVLGSLG